MIWVIAKKEIISNLLSYKFFIVILLSAVLIFTSFFIMHRDFKHRLSDYHLIKPKSNEPIAVIPPNVLSIFVKGLDDTMTRSFEISVTGITVRTGRKSGNIIFSFFPTPDFLYIVKVVLSLVALLFGFDQISREKEKGTLGLMLSNSLSRAKVLLGKWIGNFLSLSIPFLLVTILGFVLLNLDSDIYFSSNNLIRLILIILITLIYIALFLSLGILISALTKRATTSIVVLLSIWALLVFIIPNLGTLIARQKVDVPSVIALSEKRQQIWTREVLLRITKGNWETHFNNINNENDKLEEDYRNKFNRLLRLSKNINRISPVACFVYAVTEITASGVGEEAHLKREIIRYKNQIFLDILYNDKKEYPAFKYRYRSLSQVFAQGALFDISWLISFNVFLFTLSYFSFVKYDVR
jgi:ABC-type transport system involved in multi-copper enzyme maturation permease subunit